MTVQPTALPEVLLIQPRTFGDDRGLFFEAYSERRYREYGIDQPFVQDNISYSRRHVLRGLHYQLPYAQAKLVQVLAGEVFDVVVDVRLGSPRFGEWIGITLDSSSRQQLYIPTGFAHGFLVMSDEALFSYKCTAPYHPSAEHAVRWDDPQIGVRWPHDAVIVSPKDASASLLVDLPHGALPTYE